MKISGLCVSLICSPTVAKGSRTGVREFSANNNVVLIVGAHHISRRKADRISPTACGTAHPEYWLCVHTTNGEVWCVQDVFTPERVADSLDGKKVVAISAGAAHSLAVVAVG